MKEARKISEKIKISAAGLREVQGNLNHSLERLESMEFLVDLSP
jgi:hypothetical protein